MWTRERMMVLEASKVEGQRRCKTKGEQNGDGCNLHAIHG